MESSILNSVKRVLGIEKDYPHFDEDIIMHINSVFSILGQLGVGPDEGFMIEDADAEWSELTGDDKLYNMVKSYVYLRVRMLFDPPTTSYLLGALEKQVEEMTYRISTYRESNEWVDPEPRPIEEPDDEELPGNPFILSGGTP